MPPTPCPTCGHTVVVVRKRKLPCPGCGCPLFVVYDPEIREMRLLNEEGRIKFEGRAEELSEINEGIRHFGTFGLTKQMIEDKLTRLRSDGQHWKYRDAVWALCNEMLLNELSGRADLQRLGSMYYALALISVKNGNDPTELLRESNKMELLYTKQGSKRDVEITGPCGCDSCKALHGKRMTVDEALRLEPIPNPGCTRRFLEEQYPFCRCRYSEVFD